MGAISSEQTLAAKLRQAREEAGLTQERLAQALGVSRELVALWERGDRRPSSYQLARLAAVCGVEESSLLSPGPLRPLEGLGRLIGEEEARELQPEARQELLGFLDFLDAYARFLEEVEGESLPAGGRPPRALEAREGLLTDLRQASSQALRVRAHYDLGQDALPDLYTFLDELGVLVYKAHLPPEADLWGAFYRHPRLGAAVLVNVNATPGRQSFTLAHELAHFLYHGRLPGILCRRQVSQGEPYWEVERFANAWAAHFLVPGKALKEQARRLGALTPEGVVLLAGHFRASYTLLLYRLANEGLLAPEKVREWSRLSPGALARRLGLEAFSWEGGPREQPASPLELGLRRYPPSVLARVRRAVLEGRLSPGEAASLLDVDVPLLREELLAPPEPGDQRELWELEGALDFTSPGRKPRRPSALEA
ncbi:XRE family transcriptional regulator [Thermus filiformis]|uniref:HTH cro/C1-type domain-containing protein n=1 Tax=Thermus filiformis TaxID=276 RepID=A0A0A2WVG7_THEFI|nr:XRE family transcriptional regulator [Thermus filiformis]KGQ22295.1 hypothetical protein THFILI_00565 [Thermus filiformis]